VSRGSAHRLARPPSLATLGVPQR